MLYGRHKKGSSAYFTNRAENRGGATAKTRARQIHALKLQLKLRILRAMFMKA